MKTNLKKSLLALWVAFMIGLTACGSTSQVEPPSTSVEPITQSQTETAETTASDQTLPTDSSSYSTDISDLPVYSGEPYVPITIIYRPLRTPISRQPHLSIIVS